MRIIALAAVLVALAACSGSDRGRTAANSIENVSAEFEAAFNRGDAQAIAELYSEDAVILAPGAPWLQGRDSVVEVWQKVLAQEVRDLDLETVSLDQQRNSATELGRFTMTTPDGQGGRQTVGGRYVVYWKRNLDGAWRLHWDIWNHGPAGG